MENWCAVAPECFGLFSAEIALFRALAQGPTPVKLLTSEH